MFDPFNEGPARGIPPFANLRQASQKKRRLINRRSGGSKKRMLAHCNPRSRYIPWGKKLVNLKVERFQKKNERRASCGLPPLENYSEV